MRQKIADVVRETLVETPNDVGAIELSERIADALMQNNTVIFPIPLGSTYYYVLERNGIYKGKFYYVKSAKFHYHSAERVIRDYGKLVFSTLEEAESKAKEMNTCVTSNSG